MSCDFQVLKPCKHVEGRYDSDNCVVCLGTNFYFDIVLTQFGEPTLARGLIKAVQEIIHLFRNEPGTFGDYGYPEYGSQIYKFIGSKNLLPQRLKVQVLDDLNYITNIKERQQQQFRNIDSSELIKDIVGIKTSFQVDEQSVELSCIIGDTDTVQFFPIGQFRI